MDIETHQKEFESIVERYNLADEQKAEKISSFLTNEIYKEITTKEFAELFGMTNQDATIFLSFISKGLSFKEQHIDQQE